ncbi:hypothetical protein FACS1894187_05530 [Synergistales bacterium]|nr:hypothetical protein FACS1894187_05530 [Synergistales bacterium]
MIVKQENAEKYNCPFRKGEGCCVGHYCMAWIELGKRNKDVWGRCGMTSEQTIFLSDK